MRKVACYMNVLFGLMCAGLLAYRGYSCGHDSGWHGNPGVRCFLPPGVGIYNITSNYDSLRPVPQSNCPEPISQHDR